MIKKKKMEYFVIFNNVFKVKDDPTDSVGWLWLMQLCHKFPVKVIRKVEKKMSTPQM
jgi:hypothetical protein